MQLAASPIANNEHDAFALVFMLALHEGDPLRPPHGPSEPACNEQAQSYRDDIRSMRRDVASAEGVAGEG
jgi:hypothetical protein